MRVRKINIVLKMSIHLQTCSELVLV